MKTVTSFLVSASLALSASSAFASDVNPPAASHPVAMSDAAMSKVVAGAGYGVLTAGAHGGAAQGLYNGLYVVYNIVGAPAPCPGTGNLQKVC
jgi:hypothetical protein